MVQIKQDFHTGAVLQVSEYEGVPVLVHQGGRYPSLVTDAGGRIERYIDVGLYHDGFHVTGRAGYENGCARDLGVGKAATIEEAAALYPAAVRAINNAPQQYAEARSLALRCGCGQGPLARDGYEVLAAEFGFDPESDAALGSSYGAEYGDYRFPAYALADLPRLWLNQRRAWGVRDAAEKRDAVGRMATIAILRQRPVSRIETRLMPRGISTENLRRGTLYTIIKREPHGTISEDDPAVHGSHLLGHEGELGEMVTVEVRVRE